VFTFDFATATPERQEVELKLPALAGGAAGAVLFWFDLQLDAECRLSCEPGNGSSLHWRQGMQFLQEARVDASMTLPLIAKHDGMQLSFKWQTDAMPPEAFARVPVFDPRAVAAAAALDRQTLEMLHHCRVNAGSHADVADLAMRFALDPARHGIDPGVARRFAAAFLDT
jgi:type III protein arginine methyltransferase